MEQEDIKGSTRPGRGWTMREVSKRELEGSPLRYAADTTMIRYVTTTGGYQQKLGVSGMLGMTGSSQLRARTYMEHDKDDFSLVINPIVYDCLVVQD